MYKLLYYLMEPHSATKKEVLMHETTLMNLNKIMLSKRKQAQEGRADSISMKF